MPDYGGQVHMDFEKTFYTVGPLHRKRLINKISPVWDCWTTTPDKRQNSFAKGGAPEF